VVPALLRFGATEQERSMNLKLKPGDQRWIQMSEYYDGQIGTFVRKEGKERYVFNLVATKREYKAVAAEISKTKQRGRSISFF
jgi:hypothetical protein